MNAKAVETPKSQYGKFAALVAAVVLSYAAATFGPKLTPESPLVPVVEASPESWIVTDADGLRINSPEIEKIAGTLDYGTYRVLGIPHAGEPYLRLVLTVAEEGTPTPAPPVIVSPIPEPKPAPVPVPSPDKAPVDVPGFRCLMLCEAKSGTPDAFMSPSVAEYLASHCVKDADGKPEWYRLDDDDSLAGLGVWEKYRAAAPANLDGEKNGYLVVGNGTTGYAGPAPSDPVALLALLKKHGGE